jgi:hypothetical protein
MLQSWHKVTGTALVNSQLDAIKLAQSHRHCFVEEVIGVALQRGARLCACVGMHEQCPHRTIQRAQIALVDCCASTRSTALLNATVKVVGGQL